MLTIKLPISKSIANRVLLLQAIHGDELMPVSAAMPDDVQVMRQALEQLRTHTKGEPLSIYLGNCGTALRFLQVHIAQCYPGEPISLDGDARLKERDGRPTSQTTSALILHGKDVPVEADESPYITMTRKVAAAYPAIRQEADWSSAAFWYEYTAIHGGELLLEGLTDTSLQGDRAVADLYARYFGVQTVFTPQGAVITAKGERQDAEVPVAVDFSPVPDLYPAIALTCERLGRPLQAAGTERLRYKECDRLEAVRLHEVRNDHRMAMALMAADFPVTEVEQKCIAKSYPLFTQQWYATVKSDNLSPQTRKRDVNDSRLFFENIVPIKGVNDDHLGKKHALSKLIHTAIAEYVWLHDDDVEWPREAQRDELQCTKADLIILPLRMESERPKPSILERLQIVEYAAIQELTMRTAKKGRAVMCSGANLIVRREAWLNCEAEQHPEIPSGDDMFLLEAMKRHGMKIAVLDEPGYTAVVRPVRSLRAFLRQRMRWAGKAPFYTDRDIRRCGMMVALANLLQVMFPPLLLVKFPIEYSLIRRRLRTFTLWEGLRTALLLEMIYPFYMLACLFGGLVRSSKW